MTTKILLKNETKTVSPIMKHKTNFQYSIGYYTVINGIIEVELRFTN